MANVTSEQLLVLAFGILLLGALVGGLLGKDWRKAGIFAVVCMAAAAALSWTLAVRAIVSGSVNIGPLVVLKTLGAGLTFHIDRLSAVFLIVVPFVALSAMLYAVEFMQKVHQHQSPGRYYPFALLLMAAILGVITSSDLFFFIMFWELMTLASWALVWFDREDEGKVRAAWQYFVATHVAAACILVAAIILHGKSGSFAFADIGRAVGDLARTSPALVHVLMALFLIGFATKAGMFPLGGWLPQAYPAAPAPASAMFAGSMTKLGIYGIVRVFFELLQAPELTTVWGGIIATLGAGSIFVGTLTALREDDAKRVLSFHIIGQIGYMLLGIGIGLFFLRTHPALATVALIAGLYHVVNHACYKSLLFLNVGAAEYQTGTRDLNKIGGLGALMPVTMAAVIVASLSIAGIPPFSGFVSKWLIYQSTIQGGIRAPGLLVLGIVAMFISLVTLASFMKLIGSVFLGQLATNGKTVKGDVPASMKIPQIGVSAACILLGIAPILPLVVLYGAARDVLGQSFAPSFATLFGSNPTGITLSLGAGTVGVWNPAYILIAMVACGVLAYAIMRSGKAPTRQTAPWFGGEEAVPEEVRFRAHGLFLPFKEGFANVYPSLKLPKTKALDFLRVVFDFDKWLYDPLVNGGGRLTDRISRTHSGLPYVYMLWQVLGVAAALAIIFAMLRSMGV